TGIRATVFCNLRWYMYSPYNKTLHLPAELTKSSRDRIIGLNKTSTAVLCNIEKLRQSSLDDLIITQKDGNPLDRKLLYGRINKYFKRLGLSGGPHALRHYCATQLLKAGVPIIKVSKFLGHSDIMTTQKHYEHLVVSDFAHIADVLDD
ncbi:MAG: tyrosine-type recombinase/integrase, partial [Planctomycetota bacterium]